MTPPAFARLYPIVDFTGLPGPAVLALAEELLAAGVPWLQLRCKGTATRDQLALACVLVARAAHRGARVIVNDRVDVALAAGAAGVHLGQDDLPLDAARRVAGHRLVVGISTHSLDEARRAQAGGADYVGFGPMFPTASKPDALAPRSLEELRRLRTELSIPIVAIGGITEATASEVFAAGADAVAMISALATAPDPRALASRLLGL